MFFKENGQYRCAVYLRLSRSDGDQQESNSIKNQRALLNDYLGKHPELHKVDEYVDDGYSGTNFERPDFKRMMQDIEKRNVNCIIVKDLSRFGRNYIETGRYLERIFPFMGINYKIKKSQDVGTDNWIRVEGTHDAIISRGEFQQVQQLMELDTRTSPSQKTVYPLSGFLRCADCGQNMIRRTVTKKGKKYQYYHCSTYKNGGDCTPHMINGEKLEGSVLAAIRHQVALLVEAEQVLSHADLASGEQIGVKILDGQINALEAELERYRNLKVRLYQDFCDDVVSKEEYSEMNARFAQKIKEAQDKIQAIQDKKQEAVKHDTMLPGWLEELKQYQHIKTLERRVVVELIDHIDIHSKEEIEIHFCFEDELHSITEKFMEYQAHNGKEVAEE